jgi:L-amino acid N-acyltransferase YncA
MDIRAATAADLPQILAIYNDVIATTDAIYEESATTLEARQAWFAERTGAGFPVLVAELNGAVAGFSTFGPWRARWGYRHTVEHSVHVRADQRGKGIGGALIEALWPHAHAMGIHVMIGGIDSQAKASLRLHTKLGFEVVATFREVGRRHGGWLDLVMMQKFI